MRIHPLFTVKKAAQVLNVDKHFLREHLESGLIRGEKRRVGEKEKWFIYHGEVDDLRTSKRLPLLLEKAERLSLEGMGAMFPNSPEIAGVPSESVVENEFQVATDNSDADQVLDALEAVQAPVEEQQSYDIMQAAADQEAAFREQFADKSLFTDTVYETASTEINGPFDHFENFEHLGDLAVDVAAIFAEQPVASFTSTSTSEILNFDPQMPDAQTFNMAPAPHSGLPANLADTTESVDSTLAGIPLGDFAPEMIDQTSFEDESTMSFAVEEAAPADESVTPIINPMLRGLASVTLDEVLQKLTFQFAQRIAEERNAVLDLQRQLTEKDEALKLLPDLEKQLQKEKKTRAKHEEEVSGLKEKIAELEKQLQQSKTPVEAKPPQKPQQPKSWWKKLLGTSDN